MWEGARVAAVDAWGNSGARQIGAPQTILVVEDDQRVGDMLLATLQLEGYSASRAWTGEEGLLVALRDVPGLIIVDITLPGIDGFAVVEHLRADLKTAHIPIIMLSARHETQHKVRAFAYGVDDYLTKPFSVEELLARIRARMHVRESYLSPLTALPAGKRIEQAITQQLESGGQWALIYFDLDNFKAYNDTYGFVQGNHLIELMAQIAVDCLREEGAATDFLGHIGGDDFLIVTAPDRVAPLCEGIMRRWDAESRALYAQSDLARGTLEALDRQGRPQSFPLVAVSLGVVTNERRPISTIEEISQAAAEVKAKAKSSPGSGFYVDQRTSARTSQASHDDDDFTAPATGAL
jgi:diguanylate cyclase (GGDEF)-like protein